MKILLINTYELGRQPYSLAHLASFLRSDGFRVHCSDTTVDQVLPVSAADCNLVAVHVGMHTGARLALRLIPRLRTEYPDAMLCLFGLYAQVSEERFREMGVSAFFAGEYEPDIGKLAKAIRSGQHEGVAFSRRSHEKISYQLPDRVDLPVLEQYARLQIQGETSRVCGFVEATRGCKHTCLHCPVVPVYQGRFRVIPRDLVLADIDQQVASGAQHISYGDPDFLNGPGHSLAIVRAMHRRHGQLTFDATIKIEHLLKHAALLPELRDCGCLFVTTAVESLNETVLDRLQKNHTAGDFVRAINALRSNDIGISPTFIPFNPWEGLDDYLTLLSFLAQHDLVHQVAPIQLAIRLLIPAGSCLLSLPDVRDMVDPYDPDNIGYPWRHRDERVDFLQVQVQEIVEQDTMAASDREETFLKIWNLAHAFNGLPAPALHISKRRQPLIGLSEQWYCCAEPSEYQIRRMQVI